MLIVILLIALFIITGMLAACGAPGETAWIIGAILTPICVMLFAYIYAQNDTSPDAQYRKQLRQKQFEDKLKKAQYENGGCQDAEENTK